MYQCANVSFFDYSGLDEQQKEKIDRILYENDEAAAAAVSLPWCYARSEGEVLVSSPALDGTVYPLQPSTLPSYSIQTSGIHPIIPSYPVVVRYPSTSPAFVLNPYVPYQLHMQMPQTTGSLAMFVPANHILPTQYHFTCPLPQTGPAQESLPPLADVSLPSSSIDTAASRSTSGSDECRRTEVALGDLASSRSSVEAPSVVEARKPSWASLLRNTHSANNAIVITSHNTPPKINSKSKTEDKQERPDRQANCVNGDDAKIKLINFLRNHKVSHRSPSLLPRGLTNRTNWCYVNSTLQALVACPPFYHLAKSLAQFNQSTWDVLKLPVIKSLVKFVDEFETIQVRAPEKFTGKGLRHDIRKGVPFEPDFVYSMLQSIDHGAFKLNQQEDAEEFLSCILNNLHEEMVQVMKRDSKSDLATPVVEQQLQPRETSWQQVRSRNRTAYSVHPMSLESSPVSDIFRGQICSILQCPGQKDSTTLQPFFTLQLDVQSDKVKSVLDALEQFVSKESLVDYTCNHSKTEVEATQRTLIENLPSVLVLHLKWFVYNKDGGIQKNTKQFNLDINLEITKDLLSTHAKSKSNQNNRKYKLFAVVKHIGHHAVGGHYTVDVFHAGYNTWLRCDDDSITPITQQQVLGFTHPNVPYLIFYRRVDATS